MKIYVSYDRNDREAAELIKNRLETAGHAVWIDIEGIPGGSIWLNESAKSIELADWIIILISPNSAASRWVRSEALLALELDKPIVPLMIESAELPQELAHFEMVDATKGLERILDNVLSLLPIRQSQAASKPPISQASIDKLQDALEATPFPDRIFIAYARPQRHIAASLANLLHDCGKVVFYDAHIRAGAQWRKIIQSALDDATHMIVLWTPEARDSDEVEREVSYGLAQGITIIPLLSREIPKLPYHLHGLQYLILPESIDTVKSDLLAAIDQRSKGESDIWH